MGLETPERFCIFLDSIRSLALTCFSQSSQPGFLAFILLLPLSNSSLEFASQPSLSRHEPPFYSSSGNC